MAILGRGISIVILSISFLLLSAGLSYSIPTREGTSDWTPVLPEDFVTEFPRMVTIQGDATGGTGYVEELVWNQTAGPPALNITKDVMKLNFTPSAPGDYTFVMKVIDSRGDESGNVSINITVVPNHPPVILPFNSTLVTDEDEDITIDVSQWVDDDDENLKFSLNGSDPEVQVNSLGFGSFQLIPEADVTGTFDLSFTVLDEFNNTLVLDVSFVVESVPDAPKFTFLNDIEVLVGTQDLTGFEDSEVLFNFTIEDPDLVHGGDTITLTSDQGRIMINGTRGYFYPAQEDVGIMIIQFTVTDAFGLNDSVSIVLDIMNVNDEPVVNISGMVEEIQVSTDLTVNFIGCSDPDQDTLTFHVRIDNGSWIEAQTYHLLRFEQTGDHTVEFKVDDGNGGVKTILYNISVVVGGSDDDDDVQPDDDIVVDDDDDSSENAFSADPIMVILASIIAVLALIFITLLVLTLGGSGKKKDPWEDFDDDEWEE